MIDLHCESSKEAFNLIHTLALLGKNIIKKGLIKMFLILFLIALFLFLTQVKTLDLGLLGKTYYVGVISEEATRISGELYIMQ